MLARSEAFAMFLAPQGDPVSGAVAANRNRRPTAPLLRRAAIRLATTFHVFCSDILAENRSVVLEGTRSSFQKGISDKYGKINRRRAMNKSAKVQGFSHWERYCYRGRPRRSARSVE